MEALAHAKATTSLLKKTSSMCALCDTIDHCTNVYPIVAGVKEVRGKVNAVGQFPRSGNNSCFNTYNSG